MDEQRFQDILHGVMALGDDNLNVDFPTKGTEELALLAEACNQLKQLMQYKAAVTAQVFYLTERINSGLTLDAVLDEVFDSFQEIIPYDRLGVALLEEDRTRISVRWTRSKTEGTNLGVGYSAPLQGSSLQPIIETGRPRIINDLETYLAEHPDSVSTQKIVADGIRSSLTCPLIAQGTPIGVMFFSSTQANTYQDAHIEFFKQLASQLALAVEKGRLYQQALDLNQLKNKFLGIATHDLRSPLAVIHSYIDILQEEYFGKLNPKQVEVTGKIQKTCRSMEMIINDLLDVSAIESGQITINKVPVDFGEFLAEGYEYNKILAEAKSIRLDYQVPSDLPTVMIDPERINQAINNFITNAIKFSFENTVITLDASINQHDVVVSVRDQGQGIPEEEQSKLFADFSKTSVRPTTGEKSTGLGLAIVKRIITEHGGRVWAESKVGEGSSFCFSIPVRQETTEHSI